MDRLIQSNARVVLDAALSRVRAVSFRGGNEPIGFASTFVHLPPDVYAVVKENLVATAVHPIDVYQLPESKRHLVIVTHSNGSRFLAHPRGLDILGDSELIALAKKETRTVTYWGISKENQGMLQIVAAFCFSISGLSVWYPRGMEAVRAPLDSVPAFIVSMYFWLFLICGIILLIMPFSIRSRRRKLEKILFPEANPHPPSNEEIEAGMLQR